MQRQRSRLSSHKGKKTIKEHKHLSWTAALIVLERPIYEIVLSAPFRCRCPARSIILLCSISTFKYDGVVFESAGLPWNCLLKGIKVWLLSLDNFTACSWDWYIFARPARKIGWQAAVWAQKFRSMVLSPEKDAYFIPVKRTLKETLDNDLYGSSHSKSVPIQDICSSAIHYNTVKWSLQKTTGPYSYSAPYGEFSKQVDHPLDLTRPTTDEWNYGRIQYEEDGTTQLIRTGRVALFSDSFKNLLNIQSVSKPDILQRTRSFTVLNPHFLKVFNAIYMGIFCDLGSDIW